MSIFKSYVTLLSEINAYAQTARDTGLVPSPFIDSSKVISSITTYNKTESDYVTNLIVQLVTLKDYYITACGTGGIRGTPQLTPNNCQKAKRACEGIISILNAVNSKYDRLPRGGKRQTRRHSKHNKNRKQNFKSRRHRNKR